MTIAFDAATESIRAASAGDPHTFSHSPSGTPRAVVVSIAHLQSTDIIVGVTYGGIPMQYAGGATDSTGESGTVHHYFLGRAVPTGTQDVVVDMPTNQTQVLAITAMTFTAGDDCEIIDYGYINDTDQADPQITLSYGGRHACSVATIMSGHNDPASLTAASGNTAVHDHDFGTQASKVVRQTTPGTSDFTAGWTGTSEDAPMGAFAFAERDGSNPILGIIGHFSASTSSVTHAVPVKVAPTVGNHLIVLMGSAGGRTLASVADDASGGSNTYVVDETGNLSTTLGGGIASCKITNTLTTSSTITITLSATNGCDIYIIEVENLDATAHADQNVSASETPADATFDSTATATLAQANELVIGLATFSAASAWVVPTDTSYLPLSKGMPTSSIRPVWTFFKVVNATTAVSFAGNNKGSVTKYSLVATYKIDSGTPGNASADFQTAAFSQFAPTLTGAAAHTPALITAAASVLAAQGQGQALTTVGAMLSSVFSQFDAAGEGEGQGDAALLSLVGSLFDPTLTGGANVSASLLGAATSQFAAEGQGQGAVTATMLEVPLALFGGEQLSGGANATANMLVVTQSVLDPAPSGAAAVGADFQTAAWSVFEHTAGVIGYVDADLLTMAISQFVTSQGGAAAVSADLQTFATSLLAPSATGEAIAASGMLQAASGVFDAVATGTAEVSTEMLVMAASVLAVVVGGQANVEAGLQSLTFSVMAPSLSGAAQVEAGLQTAAFSIFTHNASGGGGEATANADLLTLMSSQFAVTAEGKAFVAAGLVGAAFDLQAHTARGAAIVDAAMLLLSSSLFAVAATGKALTTAEVAGLTFDILTAAGTGAGIVTADINALSIQIFPVEVQGSDEPIDGWTAFRESILGRERPTLSIEYTLLTHESVLHSQRVTPSIWNGHAQEVA